MTLTPLTHHHTLGWRPPLATTLIDHTSQDPLADLDRAITNDRATHPNAPHLITLSYELGHTLEPTTRTNRSQAHPPPCAGEGRVGVPSTLSPTFPLITAQQLAPQPTTPPPPAPFTFDPSTLTSPPREHYEHNAQRILDDIAAGDAYQVNLARPLTAPFRGDAHAFYTDLADRTHPERASFTVFNDGQTRHAVCVFSPERFLSYDNTTRTLTAEPMKGTRPLAADPSELHQSPKDRAELNMITDLMRNDLARIAEPKSVRVTHPRRVAPHASGVLQATATITATAKPTTSLTTILRATFPPGSVTGAPKIRAMQIIDELEHTPRAPYCGLTLLLQPNNSFESAVNIRTAHISGSPHPTNPTAFENATLTYHTGAGIVADSTPHAEYEETQTKAALLHLLTNVPTA